LKGGLLPHDHVGKHQERQNDVGGHVDTRRRHLEREKKRKEKKRKEKKKRRNGGIFLFWECDEIALKMR